MKKLIKINNKKFCFYEDILNDDFMNNHLTRPIVSEKYPFIRQKIYALFSFILYYLIALPILTIVCKIRGVKVINRKELKKTRKVGAFIYSNHTNVFDFFTIQSYVDRHKRVNIIGYSDSTSIPIGKHFIHQLGYIPIPNNIHAMKNFMEAIKYYIDKKQDILIFPEAHVLPYYTKIRPFSATSFRYPAGLNAPVIPIVTTYYKSKFKKKPNIKIIIGKTIYPKKELSERENKLYLRDECYKEMVNISNSYTQYEYIKYIQTEPEN